MIPDLGKYAITVLSAYGASLALLIGLVVLTWRASAKARARLEEAETRRAAKHG